MDAGAHLPGLDDVAQAAPKTIYSDVRAKAIKMLAQADASEFDVRRLSADADKLTPVDAMGALEVKATIAAIGGDYAASITLFDRLLQVTTAQPEYLRRAIQVAAITGQSFRLKSLYDKYLGGQDLSVPWKREMCQLLGFNGWFRESVKLQRELYDVGEESGMGDLESLKFPQSSLDHDDDLGLPIFETERTTADVLDANGVEDETLAALFSRSISLLRGRSLPPNAARTVNVVHDDSSSGLFISFVVKGDPVSAADAEWDLFGELASEAPKEMMDGVIALGVLAYQGEADAN